jgi:MoaA/NifB/PqqE/SkfB family radical SAM enzyme
MTRDDWHRVIDQAATAGVHRIQLIGGEPTMHPDALQLVDHAIERGVNVEVFSNLVSVPDAWWDRLRYPGVSVATSYYSADPQEHNSVTGRPSHARTRANIDRAVRDGVPIRVGIIDTGDPDRAARARLDLESLGVERIRVDHVRPFGRGSAGQAPDPAGLCGRCGTGRAAVGPDGTVTPCAMSTWVGVGNVRDQALADILTGTAMANATATIRSAAGSDGPCEPDEECSPGHPGSGCNPRT